MAICFIAPLMSRHPGGVTTQGEILYNLFRSTSGDYVATSAKRNRYLRLIDMARFLVVNRRRIKVVALSVYSGPSFVLADVISILSRRLGHRIVLHLHGGGLPDLFVQHPAWARRVLQRGDFIVAPSMFLSRATKTLGFDCRVIPNVICLDDYTFRERSTIKPHLFWMRSFHPIWNPEMAVKVLARLRENEIAATLVMAGGNKGSLTSVRRLAGELQLGDAVHFPGFLNPADKAREGNAADIFLNTNRVDNMPVAVIEACAMGLPVVSTDVGGIPDLLTNEETALLVPSDDVCAMSGAVARLLNDPKLALRISRKGRKLAEQSAWPSVKEQWESLFQQLDAVQPLRPRNGLVATPLRSQRPG